MIYEELGSWLIGGLLFGVVAARLLIAWIERGDGLG